MTALTITRQLLPGLLLALATTAAASGPALHGRWVINNELTHEAQPAPKKAGLPGTGGLRPSVSVGGMPVPTPGSGGQQQHSNAPTRDPLVLQATEFSIEPVGDDLLLTYHGLGSERLLPGNDKGTVSRWSSRKLTTRYETTTRKVSRTYELQNDGRLLVTVRIKPNRARTIVQKRVFDRVP